MKKHNMTHSDEKPFKCERCSYSFITSGVMKAYKMTHYGEKLFKFDQCDYSCMQFDKNTQNDIFW
jgi:KRAB domain-containing zinc finger protein